MFGSLVGQKLCLSDPSTVYVRVHKPIQLNNSPKDTKVFSDLFIVGIITSTINFLGKRCSNNFGLMSSLVMSTEMTSFAGVFPILCCLQQQIHVCPHLLERTEGAVVMVGTFSCAGSLSSSMSTTPDKVVSKSDVPP